ncbi:PREDICTED: B-cell antigen receptor complex-associated protein beta chain [Ceratotherium simum simum]|uniref:B-cell antigen receptor complex-associated protein beta chain n=1 Tax=Ceratotherium simum simum TaxID=73337 RepID=A0ABM1CYL5_CERSS|nr:PREDICTED: B-cell antigen receptor complex-associated protein beta chain [Ceratotherium simum simum]XP_014644646.1 PREDICTED: B-cell antigen receptor complex-associated protein beta chain [Ceratotherium simum simum]
MWQYPRFVAKRRGNKVEIECYGEDLIKVNWFWRQNMDSKPKLLYPEEGHIEMSKNNTIFILTIQGIQHQDNGIYFCQRNCSKGPPEWGCGTELRVMGHSTLAQLKRRNTLKDGIIMIQTLLIILFIIVPIFLLLDKDDSKARMEEDHTYEGLDIDQTATYEDIVTLRTGEVKWSVGEHPGQE